MRPRPSAPEERLLVAAVRAAVHPAVPVTTLAGMAQAVSRWPALLENAHAHGVLPLLHHTLTRAGMAVVPRDVSERLRDAVEKSARWNLFLARSSLAVMDLLAAHGIRCLPLKGPFLSLALYGSLALRPSADVDLLIRREDASRAKAVLLAHGFSLPFTLTRTAERAYVHSMNSFEFLRAPDRLPLDLHWDITPRYFSASFPLDALWERAQVVFAVERHLLLPSRRDLVHLLAIHGTKHAWNELRWIVDLGALLPRVAPEDLTRTIEEAAGRGTARMLLLGLSLAVTLLDLTVPDPVMRAVRRDRAMGRITERVLGSLLRAAPKRHGIFRKVLFHLRARERLTDRVRYCVRLATTPTVRDWQCVPLPEPLLPLAALLRPFRLLVKYGGAALLVPPDARSATFTVPGSLNGSAGDTSGGSS